MMSMVSIIGIALKDFFYYFYCTAVAQCLEPQTISHFFSHLDVFSSHCCVSLIDTLKLMVRRNLRFTINKNLLSNQKKKSLRLTTRQFFVAF